MKRLMSLLLAGALVLGLAACGTDDSGTTGTNTSARTGTNKGTSTHSGTSDYLNNDTVNNNFATDGMGTDYEPTGNAMRGQSGVTRANNITADM